MKKKMEWQPVLQGKKGLRNYCFSQIPIQETLSLPTSINVTLPPPAHLNVRGCFIHLQDPAQWHTACVQ